MLTPLHTGQRVRTVGGGEFGTVTRVAGDVHTVRADDGTVRNHTRSWLVTGPDEDCDPFDNEFS
jgi:preprotein translocase subunit YajC